MSFNVSALDTFRNANLGGQDAIANLGEAVMRTIFNG